MLFLNWCFELECGVFFFGVFLILKFLLSSCVCVCIFDNLCFGCSSCDGVNFWLLLCISSVMSVSVWVSERLILFVFVCCFILWSVFWNMCSKFVDNIFGRFFMFFWVCMNIVIFVESLKCLVFWWMISSKFVVLSVIGWRFWIVCCRLVSVFWYCVDVFSRRVCWLGFLVVCIVCSRLSWSVESFCVNLLCSLCVMCVCFLFWIVSMCWFSCLICNMVLFMCFCKVRFVWWSCLCVCMRCVVVFLMVCVWCCMILMGKW